MGKSKSGKSFILNENSLENEVWA